MQGFHKVLVVAFSVIPLSCTENYQGPIAPPKDPTQQYVWSIDTIRYAPIPGGFVQTIMLDVWGSSDTAVYVVGHDYYSRGQMWKFNGVAWDRLILSANERPDGILSSAFSLSGLFGLAWNDVYAFGDIVGYDSKEPTKMIFMKLLLHYDGMSWSRISLTTPGILLQGTGSPGSIVIGGDRGEVYSFSQGSWSIDTISGEYPYGLPSVYPLGIYGEAVNAITRLHVPSLQTELLQLIRIKNDTTIVLDSTNSTYPRWGTNTYWGTTSPNVYAVGTGGIDRFNGVSWSTLNGSNRFSAIEGVTEHDIYAVDFNGGVHHYDGTRWTLIHTLPIDRVFSADIAVFPNSLFIIMISGDCTIVFRGVKK
ncbi:MAG: hypothetical protein F9K22_07040 [Bacteroidetes bacterium]|nr:MAG: hypothetical protein F9K22_07040 [Bacteroidota bacterium]